ncbi:MAG: SDR family NAD(P)-dependent oxidoreductase, partial [Candidatus Tectomicrobia bacterium]|nr:SDR family NAD(P)-dependent oxidoreductase [Candidatus Tectomicrobia bacterium]
MDLGLREKVAVVTGGSEGIGKASAMRLAMEGAKVSICARREDVLKKAEEEIRAKTGGEILTIRADVSKAEQVEQFINKTIEVFGGIDILVNNAGTSAAGPFENVSDDYWQADLDLKLFGAIRCIRLAIPSMKKRGGGRIINITNIGGKQPGARSVPTSVSRA